MGNTNRRYSWTTSDLQVLDVRHLQREGTLTEGCTRQWRWWRTGGPTLHEACIQAQHTHVTIAHACPRNAGKEVTYSIPLERTPCNLGGHRVWWRCPMVGCGRRVAVLYGYKGAYFACRHCHNLNYKSQRECIADRQFRSVEKLRERLGWQRGIAHGNQGKPAHMHWRTYHQLVQKHKNLERHIIGAIARRFSLSP